MGWGEAFALLSAVTWAFAVILLRRSGETLPAFELNLVKNLLGALLLVPTIAIFSVRAWPGYPPMEVATLLLSGFLGIAVADTWYLKALNLMGAARTGIVASLYSPFVLLLSALFLADILSGWQWVGFATVMAGVLMVTWRRGRGQVPEPDLKKGVFYGTTAVFLMAVGIVMVKHILDTRPFLWTVELRLVGGLIGMFGLIIIQHRWKRVADVMRRPQPWSMILFAGFLSTYLAMIFWLAGYRLTQVSVAAVLNETASPFIVLFAWLFLREPIDRRRLLGLALTMAGVLTMLLA